MKIYKSMRNFRLLILVMSTVCALSTYSQDYKSKFGLYGNLLSSGRYLEMSKVYTDKDSINPFLKLNNKIVAAIANNQNRYAISLINDNLRYNWQAYGFDALYLADVYFTLCKAEGLYDQEEALLEWLKHDYYPSQMIYYNDKKYTAATEKLISDEENSLKAKVLISPVHAIRKDESQAVKFSVNPIIRTKIKLNGETLDAIWTTELRYPLQITPQVADQLGIVCGKDSVAGCPVVYLDSINIGNLQFNHVPALVSVMVDPTAYIKEHKLSRKYAKELKAFYTRINVPQIGLPIIRLLEKIAIDWKHQIINFPTDTLPKADFEESMYFAYPDFPALYLPVSINNEFAVGQINLGNSDYIVVRDNFYKKCNFPSIKGKNITVLKNNRLFSVPLITLKSPSVLFGGHTVDSKKKLSVRSVNDRSSDVEIGLSFFKSLGQTVVFDFKQMKVQVWKKGIPSK